MTVNIYPGVLLRQWPLSELIYLKRTLISKLLNQVTPPHQLVVYFISSHFHNNKYSFRLYMLMIINWRIISGHQHKIPEVQAYITLQTLCPWFPSPCHTEQIVLQSSRCEEMYNVCQDSNHISQLHNI